VGFDATVVFKNSVVSFAIGREGAEAEVIDGNRRCIDLEQLLGPELDPMAGK
jgi:hypothetical protein